MFEDVKRIIGKKDKHSIVKSIKLLCIDSDMSIPELEKELGFSNGSIYNWDKCPPSVEKIVMVAIKFGVSANFLLGLIEEIE